MVLGTSSGAGKSLLATALCRWYAQQGLVVAPFKAQNMSNNARVVEGGEIGAAQYYQALAARTSPDVRMNPVLLKPEADTRSQVVLLGRHDAALSALPWRERSARLGPTVASALQALRADCEVLVIEGAGSPAEINLAASDYVNGRTAHAADARCLLVTDIDRGGAFAHLYGTHQLVDDATRARIDGFVLNRFRGDPSLLAPGPQLLEQMTGVPTVACLPMWRDHGLPEEDAVFDERFARFAPSAIEHGKADDASGLDSDDERPLRVGIVAGPRISNLDEFEPLRHVPGVELAWVRDPMTARRADWLILPGSKQTSGDLDWIRSRGLDRAIAAHVAADKPLLAICGGLQMLGRALHDPLGVDGERVGLGLLPIVTRFAQDKQVCATTATFGSLGDRWASLSGVRVVGYEIRQGTSGVEPVGGPCNAALARDGAHGDDAVIGWQRGPVLAIYLHGLFENASVMQALFNHPGRRLDAVFDGLAERIGAQFERRTLLGLIGR